MGENAAETVKEIDETRDRLDAELRELHERLPQPATWTKRLVGIAVGGGVGAGAIWLLRRRRRHRKEEQAAEAARDRAAELLSGGWASRASEALEDGRWKPWVAGAAGLWVAFRLAELRQLRRLNRAALSPSR